MKYLNKQEEQEQGGSTEKSVILPFFHFSDTVMDNESTKYSVTQIIKYIIH